jgi:hypothetical protein
MEFFRLSMNFSRANNGITMELKHITIIAILMLTFALVSAIPRPGAGEWTEMPAATKGDYEVGYGKPPRGAGFKKGQSGNPLPLP